MTTPPIGICRSGSAKYLIICLYSGKICQVLEELKTETRSMRNSIDQLRKSGNNKVVANSAASMFPLQSESDLRDFERKAVDSSFQEIVVCNTSFSFSLLN